MTPKPKNSLFPKNATNAHSIGEIFPLHGTLCQKLQEELARFFSDASDQETVATADAAAGGGRNFSGRDSHGSANARDESRRDGGGAATETDRVTQAAGGGRATDRDGSATRFAVETIRESIGVSAELAAYALSVSKVHPQKLFSCRVAANIVICRA